MKVLHTLIIHILPLPYTSVWKQTDSMDKVSTSPPLSATTRHSSSASASASPPSGLLLRSSPAIREFLSSTTAAPFRACLPHGTSASTSQLAEADVVPYCLVRDVWAHMPSSSRPRLRDLLAPTVFCLEAPTQREKSDELKARLEKLQDLADRKAYDELVKDVKSKGQKQESFSSYKYQLGFGLHVMVTMFTCFLVGYVLFRSLFVGNPTLPAAGGFVGLVIGMLVETLLFIIRFSEERPSNLAQTAKQFGSKDE